MMDNRLFSKSHPVSYKQSDPRRHKFKKLKCKVTNWPEYNEALRQRGDISVWMSEDAVNNWHESRETYSGRGRPKTYSDIAVQVCLLFRQLYSLPLRRTQGVCALTNPFDGVTLQHDGLQQFIKELRRISI
jgi:hypothetical protein